MTPPYKLIHVNVRHDQHKFLTSKKNSQKASKIVRAALDMYKVVKGV
jgi:hypothetical protein